MAGQGAVKPWVGQKNPSRVSFAGLNSSFGFARYMGMTSQGMPAAFIFSAAHTEALYVLPVPDM